VTPLIPRHLPIDDDISIPPFDPRDRFLGTGPSPAEAFSDERYTEMWGTDWVPNVAILRRGQSVLFPMLSKRGAPSTFQKIWSHLANKHREFVSRQQPAGLRLWRTK
jgi:hypothetical protein